MEPINSPYIKKYDESGKLINPLNGQYLHAYSNRKQRRSLLQNKSFTGNSKGIKLTVSGKFKYERVVQFIVDKITGKTKKINHFLAK